MGFVKLIPILMILCPIALFGQQEVRMSEADFIAGVNELARLGATRPFLRDSSDVLLESQSLNKFFTDRIYQRLTGNAYFGYRFDEGFFCDSSEVSIVEIRDLTGATGAAYRLALEQALAEHFNITPNAVCQIGLCIVGIETAETNETLPGVMVEAYLRNSSEKKSFFIRFGAGSPRGLAAAVRLSASMLAAELEARRERR
jgi:hypothetical protein